MSTINWGSFRSGKQIRPQLEKNYQEYPCKLSMSIIATMKLALKIVCVCGELASDFFQKFLSLLYEDGVNQYENPEQPFPEGYVPIITIHQAKGLEFPVVVVGSLDRARHGIDLIDKELQRFYLLIPA